VLAACTIFASSRRHAALRANASCPYGGFAAQRFGPAIRNPKAFTIEWPLANANPRSGFVSLANSFNFDDLVDILQH